MARAPRPIIACPACLHSRGPAPSPICPECGVHIDVAIPFARRRRRRTLLTRISIVLFLLYAPHCWLLFIDYPWNDYHWYWIKMWPILPGLLPSSLIGAHAFGGQPTSVSFTVLIILLLLLLIAGMIWASCRSWRWFAAVAIILAAYSIGSAFILYGLFLM